MTESMGAIDAILEFVDLAMARRRGELAGADRGRIDQLETYLRDVVDGARPAPRKIEGRNVSQIAPRSSGPAAAASITPAKVSPGAPRQSGLAGIAELADRLELSSKDKQKLKNEIRLEDLPRSGYTPTKSPAFLDDYYSSDIVMTGDIAWAAAPKTVKRADGERDLEVPKEALVLLGVESPEPPPPAEPARPAAPTPPSGPSTPAPPVAAQTIRGRPAIVHLLSGGVLRGQIDLFDPASGWIDLLGEQTTGEDSRLGLDQVMAVFFGMFRGEEAQLPAGQRVAVRLVNDRQVTGVTEDYQEGGDSLTIAPEQKRGNVHRIWIPAWAVKEIHLV
ncbi:hypothetical protein L6R52_18525 [Myxococcota bacterium]|nr:hypothetical protein [Myxococcota bacterium]